jgi:hypothetical protein
MNHLRRTATIIVGLAASVLGLVAATPSAFAMRLVTTDDSGNPTTVSTITHAGMTGWAIALIALGAALAASVTTIIVLRRRPRPTVHPASH